MKRLQAESQQDQQDQNEEKEESQEEQDRRTAFKEVGEGERGLQLSYWDVVEKMEYPGVEEVDAVLLTGSRMSISILIYFSEI